MNTVSSTEFIAPTSDEPIQSTTSAPSVEPRIRHICERCNRVFSRKTNLDRHRRICGIRSKDLKHIPCPHCNRSYLYKSSLTHHLKTCLFKPTEQIESHDTPTLNQPSTSSDVDVTKRTDLRSARSKKARLDFPRDEESGIVMIESAFNNRLKTYFIENRTEAQDLENYFTLAFETVKDKIEQHLTDWQGLKVNFALETKHLHPITEELREMNFKTKNAVILKETDIDQIINDGIDSISTELEEFETKGSGFSLHSIDGILLNVNKYDSLKVGCRLPLPKWIVHNKSCDTVQYSIRDNDCFIQSVLARNTRQYDFSDISTPTKLTEIEKFERRNKVNINIFGLTGDSKRIFPYQPSKHRHDQQIDLLLLTSDSHNHFVRIFDFERLVRPQLTAHGHAIIICRHCFQYFDSRGKSKEEKFSCHRKYCIDSPLCVKMPTPDKNI